MQAERRNGLGCTGAIRAADGVVKGPRYRTERALFKSVQFVKHLPRLRPSGSLMAAAGGPGVCSLERRGR
ncbi:hypothetical protein EYF80_018529 [Liparis tanakae]|uniref:Uncharacterized protein n=1 Tax=Liparis tanakae TaxID=230148 RepID=A0A4Z2I042_9TELE|nr:hypothetical protein EYF80_018529 [Liparis tanakae]